MMFTEALKLLACRASSGWLMEHNRVITALSEEWEMVFPYHQPVNVNEP